jgi:hypothetical protein
MNAIFFVEDRMGLSFNGRRLSRDRVLTSRIVDATSSSSLFVSKFSAELFDLSCTPQIVILGNGDGAEIFANGKLSFSSNDFILTEDQDIPDGLISGIYLYKWNRKYPFDRRLEIDFTYFNLVKSTDFVGYSHDCISEEIYERKAYETI